MFSPSWFFMMETCDSECKEWPGGCSSAVHRGWAHLKLLGLLLGGHSELWGVSPLPGPHWVNSSQRPAAAGGSGSSSWTAAFCPGVPQKTPLGGKPARILLPSQCLNTFLWIQKALPGKTSPKGEFHLLRAVSWRGNNPAAARAPGEL